MAHRIRARMGRLCPKFGAIDRLRAFQPYHPTKRSQALSLGNFLN